MRDFSKGRPSSSEQASTSAPEAVPGKSTLVDGLRGLGAQGVTSSEAIAPAAPAASHRGMPEAGANRASSLELLFGSPKRGLKGGQRAPGEVVRGFDLVDTAARGNDGGSASGGAGPSGSASGGAGPSGHSGGPGPSGSGSAAPPPAHAPAVTITTTTSAGPTFGPQGASLWHIAFHTTGRTGWIVQKIDNTLSGTDAHGQPMTPASIGLAPHYYEAWSVDAHGAVTPHISGDNDYWDQGSFGANTKGTWGTTGEVFWVAGAATPSGMSAGGVANAGMLVSSVSAPAGLGSSLLHRHATGTWDATVTPAVDRGTAGP